VELAQKGSDTWAAPMLTPWVAALKGSTLELGIWGMRERSLRATWSGGHYEATDASLADTECRRPGSWAYDQRVAITIDQRRVAGGLGQIAAPAGVVEVLLDRW
jgi:hypothetical protein